MIRARFRRDPPGFTFEILVDGRIVRQGWVAGKMRDAMAAADAEMVEMNRCEYCRGAIADGGHDRCEQMAAAIVAAAQ